jgi:hypothetical protein
MRFTIALLAVSMLGVGCAASHGGGDSSSTSTSTAPNTSSGLAAFQTGFYAFAQTQGCVQCHGASQAPLFAVSDVNSAYTAAMSIFTATTPNGQLFESYATSGHCGVASICGDTAIQAQVDSLIQAWVTAEDSASGTPTTPGGPQYTTGTVSIPANLPMADSQNAKAVVMSFPLASLGVASLTNATFKVSIIMINPTEYQLSNPTITGNTAAVDVSGIHVFIRPSTQTGSIGNEDPQGELWDSLQATVAFPAPTTVPPMATTVIDIEQLSSSDQLTIGFDSL